MPQPYKVFTIYAREDELYLSELLGQLRPLEIANRIKVWSDREINPGVEWEKEIISKLDTADIILILVSAAYYNSVYIHEVEIKYALSRHERGEARVLPLIVRPCSFLDDPIISKLQVLPTDGKPVTDRRHWQERDDAWMDVVAGVKRTLDSMWQAELMRMEAVLPAERERQRDALVTKGNAERKRKDIERQKKSQEHIENEQQSDGKSLRLEKEQAKESPKNQTQLEARPIDSETWQQAADTNTYDSYQAYLKQFPKGNYALAAQYRLKGLRKSKNGPNQGHTNKIIIFSGVGWGIVELIALRAFSIDEMSVYQVGSDIYWYIIINPKAPLLTSLPIMIFTLLSTKYILKRQNLSLITTVKDHVFFGAINIGILGVTTLTLLCFNSVYIFYIDHFFILTIFFVLLGATLGFIYGIIARKKN